MIQAVQQSRAEKIAAVWLDDANFGGLQFGERDLPSVNTAGRRTIELLKRAW